MSYSIEYNRQFIKTENGYTPCWLVGDNNVTEGFGRNERRVRNWSVFMNLLDVTEDELVEKAKELLAESFGKQADGTFNQEYMMSFIPRMLELIRPESVEQVKNIMMNHKA